MIANSSTEAEFISLCECVKELSWFKSWLKEVLLIVPNEYSLHPYINVNVDNTAAITIASPDSSHKRLKHIDIKYFYIKEKINNDNYKIVWTPTKLQLADILTKRLPTDQFTVIRDKLLFVPQL